MRMLSYVIGRIYGNGIMYIHNVMRLYAFWLFMVSAFNSETLL